MAAIEQKRTRATPAAADRPAAGQIQPGGSATEGRPQRLLPVGAAADYLGVSRATVERLVHCGELPIVKIGGSTRYDVDDLDSYIAIKRCRNRKRTA
jgi:excisionase family DNA binding protein